MYPWDCEARCGEAVEGGVGDNRQVVVWGGGGKTVG